MAAAAWPLNYADQPGQTCIDFGATGAVNETTWTGGTGTTEISTEITRDGSPTLKVVMPAACTRVDIGVTSGKLFTLTTFDENFAIDFYLSGYNAISNAQAYLGDSSYTTVDLVTLSLSNETWNGWHTAKWYNTAPNESNSSKTGTIALPNIVRAKLRINKSAGAAVTLYVGVARTWPRSRPKIVWGADDATSDHYTYLKDAAITAGIPWALGISSSLLNTGGFMTSAQVASMDGDDSGLFRCYSHSTDNNSYASLGASAYFENWKTSRDVVSGLTGRDAALYHPWVQGSTGQDIRDLLAGAGCKVARLAAYIQGQTLKSAFLQFGFQSDKLLQVPIGLSLESTISLATAKAVIDSTCKFGGTLFVMAHVFSAGAPTGLEWQQSDATALMAYAKAKQAQGLVDNVSVEDWYLGLTQPALVAA